MTLLPILVMKQTIILFVSNFMSYIERKVRAEHNPAGTYQNEYLSTRSNAQFHVELMIYDWNLCNDQDNNQVSTVLQNPILLQITTKNCQP
jgi:hypothetical protein